LLQSGVINGLVNLYPVVFTGGEAARFDEVTGSCSIRKSLIISNFLSLMQRLLGSHAAQRFDYSPGLEALPLLRQEILARHMALFQPDVILAACKTFIELIIPPKPDRHITTTIEIQERADVSEYMDNGDKDRGADTSERDEPEGAGRDDAGTGSIPS